MKEIETKKIIYKMTEHPKFVAYHFLNGNGELKCMEEDGKNTDKFLKEGFNVDGSSIGGSMLTVDKSDLKVMPEKESFLHFQIGDFVHDRYLCHLLDNEGKPHDMDPRGIFQNLIEKARKMGFEPYMFSEVDFYIVNEDGTPVDPTIALFHQKINHTISDMNLENCANKQEWMLKESIMKMDVVKTKLN